MSNFCIMRAAKLKNLAAVCSSLDHELRLNEVENADPDKLVKNWYSKMEYDRDEKGRVSLEKNNDREEREKAKNRAVAHFKKQLPKKVRKNAVQAVQFVMTASPEIMKAPNFNATAYLNACDKWVKDKFGAENVFFVSHHRDETTPHTNVFVLPKDEKGKLNCRKFLGGKKRLSELQDEFAKVVGEQFGLQRGVKWSKAKHQKIKEWYGALQEAMDTHQDIVVQVTKNLPAKDPSESDQIYQQRVKQAVAKALQPFIAETINHRNAEKKARALNATLEEKASTLADERAKAKIEEQEEININLFDKYEEVEKERNELREENERLQREEWEKELFAKMGRYFNEHHLQEATRFLERELERQERAEEKKKKKEQEVER